MSSALKITPEIHLNQQLPILDLSLFYNVKTRGEFLKELRYFARNIGFFYVTGHGLDTKRIEEIKQYTRDFFALSQVEKEKISIRNSPHFRGYAHVGEENTQNKPDAREQIDIGLDLKEIPYHADVPLWSRLQGPNQWPEDWPEFKSVITQWQKDARKLSVDLIHALMLALDLKEDALDAVITEEPNESLKLIKYPKQPNEDNAQGVGNHKDTNILTLLLQDHVGGLQVFSDGNWIDVPYVKDAFIINIGETLELATDGYLIANTHRVIAPKYQDRYSVAYFISPNIFSGDIPILKLPAALKNLSLGVKSDPLNLLLKNVGENNLKSRLRSHLEVTKKFYPNEYKKLLQQKIG